MVDVFTKAIVREIGRNVGKTASNALLGDSHSTPYRRVKGTSTRRSKKAILGSSTGGYKYDNQFDRLIRNFQIKGKVATFNSAQNIYNEYFKLVQEADEDGNLSREETLYLIEQYYRGVKTLKTISDALEELDANDKSQMVIEKVISMNDFMKELDDNFIPPSEPDKKVDRKPLKRSVMTGLLSFLFFICLISIWISETLYASNTIKWILAGLMLILIMISTVSYDNYKSRRQDVLNWNQNKKFNEEIKKQMQNAVNAITVNEVEVNDVPENTTPELKPENPDPLNLKHYNKDD